MRLGLLAMVAAACGGPDDDGTDVDPTTPPDDTAPVDTAPTGDDYAVDGAFWGVTGRFAFDDERDLHVPYVEPGAGPSPIAIDVVIVDSSIQYTGILDPSTSCTVTLEYDGQLGVASTWVDAHGVWAGFDLPPNPTVKDGCRGYFGLPSEIASDVGAAVAQWTWGIGVGPALDPVIEDQLRNTLSPSEWAALEPNIVAGAIVNPIFAAAATNPSPDGFANSGFALGYEVDGNFEIEVGGTGSASPLTRETIEAAETGLATGYYEVVMGYWTNAAVLGGM